jgi:hypothetical protein
MIIGLFQPLLFTSNALPSDTPVPTSVTIAGSLQSELGCPGDWQPDCTATDLAFDLDDQVWQGTFSIPAGSWEYKAALNDTWDENYGQNATHGGPNIALNFSTDSAVKFYYSHETHWVTDNHTSVIAVAAGSFQSELGCPGDWQPDCLGSWLQDPDGDGIYSFGTRSIPAGDYEAKVAINESWDENYGAGGMQNGPNIAFSVPSSDTEMIFTYDSETHILTVTPLFKLPLTALSPAKIWVGLKNWYDLGLRVDLLAEVFKNDTRIGLGQLNNQLTGSIGFKLSLLKTIDLNLIPEPVEVYTGDILKIKLSARSTCIRPWLGGGHNSGTLRLWYNGQPIDSGLKRDAGSRFDGTIGDVSSDYFLRNDLELSDTPGSSRLFIDTFVGTNAACPDRPFKEIGTWSTQYSLSIEWANLQWPPTLSHNISIVNRTDNVYGQVWIDGVTNQPGPTPTLRAQLGFGPTGSAPATSSDWVWVEGAFNVDAGNNDEFVANLLPETVGIFDYAYRYSTTNGADWVYADLDGTGNGYSPSQAGKLTVNSSGDTTAPAMPAGLYVVSASPSSIELAWNGVTGDSSLYGYEVFRSDIAGGPYNLIARVTATSYIDTNVAAGKTYFYVVRAVDLSFNRSSYSNEVSATAQLRTVTLIFNVTVPATTDATGRSVYIAGFLNRLDGGLPEWDPTGVVLTRVDTTYWTIILTGKEGTQIEYKYTLGDWNYIEKDASCGELANRQLTLSYGSTGTQTINDTVENWRNVAPCGN